MGPGGWIWGFPKRRGPSAESSVCVKSPAGTESLSARNNLPARRRFHTWARLPALWQ